jgi:5,10-methylenetetrahydromethanopterin reductase
MSADTHWGVWLHAVRPLPQLADLAAAAEDLGAAAVLVADEGTDRDLYVTLTVLAQRTRQVLLIAAVTNPHSRHPVATAAALASVAELAPDRVVAGLGAGGSRVLGPMGLSPARPYTALAESVDVIDALLGGEVVQHDGEFTARGAALPWSPGRLPIALAGRGPRTERLAAERADWVLLAGKAVDDVPDLVRRLRAGPGHPPAIAWNPGAAWTRAMIGEIRSHLAYMTIDLPPEERHELGVDDALAGRLREAVAALGPEAAGPLVPDAVLQRYAVTGSREAVVARIAALRALIRPELLLFDAGDYSAAYLKNAAAVITEAGAVAGALPASRWPART